MKTFYIALGLLLAGLLSGTVDILFPFGLAAVILLMLDAARPAWWAKAPAVIRRPMLGSIAAGIFVLSAALNAGFGPGILLYLAGTVLFVRDAAHRGELGPFEPGLLLRGPRALLLIGALLGSFAFSAAWEPTLQYTSTRIVNGPRAVDPSGRTVGFAPWGWASNSWTEGGESNAQAVDAATTPALLLVGVLALAAWRRSREVSWFRFVPLAAAVAIVLAVMPFFAVPDWTTKYHSVSASAPDGPAAFLALLAPFYLGAVLMALGAGRK